MSEQARAEQRVAGRYVLETVLGRGGMGTVWQAMDELLGRPVAIKAVEIPEAVPEAERAKARARVLREARAAARLNHPQVVTIHDVVEDGGHLYIVMELVAAPTLAEVVREHGPLPPGRVARIGEQLLDALEVAHAAGIVHRDVKPANVMLLPRDHVKVADFGIASIQGDPRLTSSGMVLGSPAFMAPEQAGGQPSGPPADLWALGATLYYAVEARVPFRRDGSQAVLAAILTQEPDPPRLAGPLAPVLAGLLAKRPEERPAGARLHQLLGAAAAAADAEAATVPLVGTAAAPTAVAPTVPSAPTGAGPTAAAATAPYLPTGAEAAEAGVPAAALSPGPVGYQPAAPDSGRPDRLPLLVVGVAVVVMVVAALLLVRAISDDPPGSKSGRGGGTAATPTTRAAGGAGTTAAPSAGSGGQGGSGSGAATGTPVKLELDEVAPPGQVLPKYWLSATNRAGGYRVGVPASFWEVTAVGQDTYLDWPGEETFRAAFEVHTHPSTQNPYELLRREAAGFAQQHRQDQYKQVKLTGSWTYQRRHAAAWEFTWVRNDKLTHARVVAFTVGSHTYSVLYRSNDVFWYGGGSAAFPQGFEEAFTPLG
ncbi:MAG TPA: serine/threonine-protein kinase [Actinomycetes bacterium]